ncbi:MAG: zinc-binding dehydrogenase [Pseudomonadota bacterium]
MKSLILKNHGYSKEQPDDIVLKDMSPFVEYGDLPDPEPSEGEVKVKVSLASVNPSDEMFIQGLYGQPRIEGNGAGFEGVGEVVASGGGKHADALVGKRIAFFGTPGKPGTWSEYSIANAATAIPLMDGVRDEDGAAMIVNPLTALGMFSIVEETGAKSFIVSAGASQLCKLMIDVAAEKGFRPIALVRRDEQIELLKGHGAAHVLNVTSDTFADDFRAISREEKPRIFLDAVANQTSEQVFAAMPNKARWIIYGVLDPRSPTLNQPGQLIFQMKQIEGFWLTRWMGESDPSKVVGAIGEAQKRFASGTWKTDVTAIVPLSEAMERLPEELAKPNGKVFIKP